MQHKRILGSVLVVLLLMTLFGGTLTSAMAGQTTVTVALAIDEATNEQTLSVSREGKQWYTRNLGTDAPQEYILYTPEDNPRMPVLAFTLGEKQVMIALSNTATIDLNGIFGVIKMDPNWTGSKAGLLHKSSQATVEDIDAESLATLRTALTMEEAQRIENGYVYTPVTFVEAEETADVNYGVWVEGSDYGIWRCACGDEMTAEIAACDCGCGAIRPELPV